MRSSNAHRTLPAEIPVSARRAPWATAGGVSSRHVMRPERGYERESVLSGWIWQQAMRELFVGGALDGGGSLGTRSGAAWLAPSERRKTGALREEVVPSAACSGSTSALSLRSRLH